MKVLSYRTESVMITGTYIPSSRGGAGGVIYKRLQIVSLRAHAFGKTTVKHNNCNTAPKYYTDYCVYYSYYSMSHVTTSYVYI